MPEEHNNRFPNIGYLPWLLLLAILIAYASTIVGPTGLHYVPLDRDTARLAFLARAFTWVDNGSDQRADWMGNLCMFVPFGFLVAASIAPRRGAGPVTFLLALVLSAGFVLAVKYAQIYFPPRTVSLNYVAAQTGGAAIGIALFGGSHAQHVRFLWHRSGGSRETLRFLLKMYVAFVFVFLLMPLDFALSPQDLLSRVATVPGLLFSMPGAGRPPIIQAMILVASALAMVPLGVLMVLAPNGRNRLFSTAMSHGLAWSMAIFALSMLLLSGDPTLISVLVRIIGLTIGIRIMPWLIRRDPDQLRRWLGTCSLLAVPPYLMLLVVANGLLSRQWLNIGDASNAVYAHGLMPLFNYYIVTKAQAAKSIAAHMVMYAPLGLLTWSRGLRPGTAFWWGLLLAAAVESCRFFRPGMQGDVNTVALAAVTALSIAKLMPHVWRLLEAITLPAAVRATTQGPGWRERAAAARLRASVENF